MLELRLKSGALDTGVTGRIHNCDLGSCSIYRLQSKNLSKSNSGFKHIQGEVEHVAGPALLDQLQQTVALRSSGS